MILLDGVVVVVDVARARRNIAVAQEVRVSRRFDSRRFRQRRTREARIRRNVDDLVGRDGRLEEDGLVIAHTDVAADDVVLAIEVDDAFGRVTEEDAIAPGRTTRRIVLDVGAFRKRIRRRKRHRHFGEATFDARNFIVELSPLTPFASK